MTISGMIPNQTNNQNLLNKVKNIKTFLYPLIKLVIKMFL